MSNNLEIEKGPAYEDANKPAKKRGKKHHAIGSKKWSFAIMDSTFMQATLGLLLILSLFMPDLWVLENTNDDADSVLFLILTIGYFVWNYYSVVVKISIVSSFGWIPLEPNHF